MAGGILSFINKIKQKGAWNPKQIEEELAKAGLTITTRVSEMRQKLFTLPEEIYVGDVFKFNFSELDHPCLVIKVEGEDVWGVILTSTPDKPYNLYKISHSRFFNASWSTGVVIHTFTDGAKKNFIGSIDSPKDVRNIQKTLKKEYKEVLRMAKRKEKWEPIDFAEENEATIGEYMEQVA